MRLYQTRTPFSDNIDEKNLNAFESLREPAMKARMRVPRNFSAGRKICTGHNRSAATRRNVEIRERAKKRGIDEKYYPIDVINVVHYFLTNTYYVYSSPSKTFKWKRLWSLQPVIFPAIRTSLCPLLRNAPNKLPYSCPTRIR